MRREALQYKVRRECDCNNDRDSGKERYEYDHK